MKNRLGVKSIDRKLKRVGKLFQTVESQNYEHPMKDQKSSSLLRELALSPNSSVDLLIRWTIAVVVIVLFILPELREWRLSSNAPKTSIVNGCVVPVNLMSERFLPEPFPINNKPTYEDQILWYEDRIDQLEIVMINMISDRRELFKRCK